MCFKLKAFMCSECCKAYSRVNRLNDLEHLITDNNIRTSQRHGRLEYLCSCCEESWRTIAEMLGYCEEKDKENLG